MQNSHPHPSAKKIKELKNKCNAEKQNAIKNGKDLNKPIFTFTKSMQKKIDKEIRDPLAMSIRINKLSDAVTDEGSYDLDNAKKIISMAFDGLKSDDKEEREKAQQAQQFLRDNTSLSKEEFETKGTDEDFDFESNTLRNYLFNALRNDAVKVEMLYQYKPFRPFLKKLTLLNSINELVRQQYNDTETIYRGTSLEELNNMLNHEFIGGGQPNERNFISMSPNVKSANRFAVGQGVIIKYNKEEIDKHIIFPGYAIETGPQINNLGQPESAAYTHEQEVRVRHDDVPVKTQKMIIEIEKDVLISSGDHAHEMGYSAYDKDGNWNEDVPDVDPNYYKAKFGKLGKVIILG